MELLSPAGSFSALCTAIGCGADAVYFGGSLFNARLNAKNFDRDEMIKALDLCRFCGVKSYITMNTLTHDRDLFPALQYASFLYEHGADALIIQDLGLFSLIHKHIPDFELHASTQMGISDLDGVRECEKIGYSRVVLSRELSLSDITHITQNSTMPIEVFVHGAMCMSFSGGCLFSSMVGSRSGNCGSCAQPCRKYAAIDHMPDKNELALSLADMCMLYHVDDLRKAGVMSLKIEGRMKKPEYIAAVTHAYRRAIDGAGKDELSELSDELYSVFNRGAFSTGYYFSDSCKTDRIATSVPSDALINKINARVHIPEKTVDFALTAHTGEEALLSAVCENVKVSIGGAVVQVPNKPIDDAAVNRAKQQIEKLGDTHFRAGSITVDMDGFLPVSAINDLRRAVTLALGNAFALRRTAPYLPTDISLTDGKDAKNTRIIAHCTTLSQAEAAFASGVDDIIAEYGSFAKDDIAKLQAVRESTRLILGLPIALLKDDFERMKENVSPEDFDGIEINNLGQLEYARRFPHVYGGYHMNVFNAHTAKLLLCMGIEMLTLSVELNPAQVRDIQRAVPSEKLALHTYGRVVLMNLYHCPIKEHIGCDRCKARFHTLFDAEGRAFPIKGMSAVSPCAVTRLYNCYPTDILPKLDKVGRMNYSLVFTTEDEKTVKDRIEAVKSGRRDALPDTTRGYFNR